MSVGTFHLPQEAVHRHVVPDLMNLLHDAIAGGRERESFVTHAIGSLKFSDRDAVRTALETLFDAMHQLDRQGKNRIWAKLIRNRYAALFFHEHFDYVVGNPPHVNWESLTQEWRQAAEAEYKRYGLFSLKGLESRLGGGKKDNAALFTYAVMDHFLKDKGVLSLVVHVSLFKTSGAGEGFRRFQLGDDLPFRVREAHDFRSFQPFQTHSGMRIKTRTLTFSAVKGEKTRYPIPYFTWEKTIKGIVPGELTWAEAVKRLASQEMVAVPLRGKHKEGKLSPWLTVPKRKLSQCKKIIAPTNYQATYRGRAGLYTHGLNGAYFVDVLDRFPDGSVLVRNMHDVGKIRCPEVQATLEGDLVYPLLRGRAVARWRAQPAGHVVVVQDPKTKRGYSEEWMQRTHPLTWDYLKKFEELLRARKSFKKHSDAKDPFYGMYAVSEATVAPHKVVWMDISFTVKAVVLSGADGNDMPIPEHTTMFVTTESEEEAHYVAAILNSDPVNTVVSGYIVDNHVSTHPIENIVIPSFEPGDNIHAELVALSREAHESAAVNDEAAVSKVEKAIDRLVKKLW